MHYAFENKSRLNTNTMPCFAPLLTSLTDQEWENMMPLISKMLKKSPDSLLEGVVYLTSCVSLDIGTQLIQVFLPLIVTKLKAQKDDIRALVIQLLNNCVVTCNNKEHLVQVSQNLADLVLGKTGILAQFYQREAVLKCIWNMQSLVNTVSEETVSAVSAILLPTLMKVVEKEAHEGTRRLALGALGVWIGVSQTSSLEMKAFGTRVLSDLSKPIAGEFMYTLYLALATTSQVQTLVTMWMEQYLSFLAKVEAKPTLLILMSL